jgi:hypothetical protein
VGVVGVRNNQKNNSTPLRAHNLLYVLKRGAAGEGRRVRKTEWAMAAG